MTSSQPQASIQTLPLVIAGPILRKVTQHEVNIWLVTTAPLQGTVQIKQQGSNTLLTEHVISQEHQMQVGKRAWISLLQVTGDFPLNTPLTYDVITPSGAISKLVPDLLYSEALNSGIEFVISSEANYVVHGSCRNPHHFSKDSLVQLDKKVATFDAIERPDMLMMSGDQIYADHVAGPMLDAIEQTIDLLGLYSEEFEGAPVANTEALFQHPHAYYGRDKILPKYRDADSLLHRFMPEKEAAIFSSRESENHLITCSEFIAMYILVWSPTLWSYINHNRLKEKGFFTGTEVLSAKWQQHWHDEKEHIDRFIEGLPKVQRLLAHIPSYMIFDDHDITDDWNLTIGWEKAALENPFSHRIIGNGLIAYWLCQGWGNAPEKFNEEFMTLVHEHFKAPTKQTQDDFIAHLYRFEEWHYTINTSPKVVVLDTRTRRWRSESRMNKPSGLMDWEAMIEFQQELMHQDKMIIVSAAPMFGVKFIEALQKMMTTLGQPLLIDAENWMAHPGSANTLLSIFTHTKTPTNFVILSGDVHYSFAYDIKLRYRRNSPNIFQITCSGIKNQFPAELLTFCDAMDRMLYSPRSPLNWLTKRKRLKIFKRAPSNHDFYRLVNQSAIGELRLDDDGKPKEISILTGEGDVITFPATASLEQA